MAYEESITIYQGRDLESLRKRMGLTELGKDSGGCGRMMGC